MPLSPHQIRAGQEAWVEGNWGQGQAHVSGLRGGGGAAAVCLAPTGTSLRYRLHNLETPGSGFGGITWVHWEPWDKSRARKNWCLLNSSSWAGGREAGRHTCWCLSAITYNKETGLYSRVTGRSVLWRWGVTDLTAVQLRLLATLLSLSLFSTPPKQMSSLTTFPHVHYQQHPTHTKGCTHRHTHVSGCSPPRPPILLQLVTTAASLPSLIPPETPRKSTRRAGVLSGPRECVCVSMCVCPGVCVQRWLKHVKHTCLWPRTQRGACISCWTVNTVASQIKSLWKEEQPSGRYNHEIHSLPEHGSN